MNYKKAAFLSIFIILFVTSIMALCYVISKSNDMIQLVNLTFQDKTKDKNLPIESTSSNYSLCKDIDRSEKQVACFDGKSNFINIPITKFSNKLFKMSFWVKFNDLQSEQPLFYIKNMTNESPQYFYISTYAIDEKYNGLYFGVTAPDGN